MRIKNIIEPIHKQVLAQVMIEGLLKNGIIGPAIFSEKWASISNILGHQDVECNIGMLKRKIESIIKSIHVPYNKGKAFYYIDKEKKSVKVFIPVKRTTQKVGLATLKIWDKLEKEFKNWDVEVWPEISSPKIWGVPTRYLVEVLIK